LIPRSDPALRLKGGLAYGSVASKKLPASFWIWGSKAFSDGALLDNA